MTGVIKLDRIKRIVGFCIFSLFTAFFSCNCNGQYYYKFQTFSPTDLQSDLKSLYGKLDTAHYNLFHAYSKKEFDSIYQNIYDGIDHPLNAAEFYFQLLPLFNLLRDSHTMLGFPFAYSKEFSKQGGLFIPIRIYISDNRIYVSENFSTTPLPLYSEILSVNGVSSNEILNTLHLMINRERQESESDYMAFFFHRILYPVYGFDKNFTLEIVSSDKQTMHFELAGIPLDKFPYSDQSNFSSRYLDSSIAVIDINACEDNEQFASFCDTVFQSLNKRKIKALVIDLRDNPGGSTFHGDTLFTYLTKGKFSQYPKKSIKYSPYSIPKSDTVYTQTFSENLEQAHTNPKGFVGDVYVLVNRSTFSSASVMAATFQCYKIGTLIGQETGGTQIFFDEPIEFKLLNSGLRFLVANQVNYCPCGTEWEKGIIPDEIVPISITDKVKGIDTEMEFVKAFIKLKGK